MLIGQAYRDWLTTYEQETLQASCDMLIDSIFSEISNVEDTKDIINTTIGGFLPHRYSYKYTPLFLRKFATCIITVAWKLAQPRHIPPSSLAEDLAVWTIIEQARVFIEMEGKEDPEEAFETFIGQYFEDLDLQFLFDDAYDGIDETQLAQTMGIPPLTLAKWFEPFSNEPSRTPHPYTTGDDHLPKT